jgi:hypothetical protein
VFVVLRVCNGVIGTMTSVEKLQVLRIKNARERGKLQIESAMPRIIEAALVSGRNISYSSKGDVHLTDWRSNVHNINASSTDAPLQIEGPLSRVTIEECVEAIEPNSFKICVGTVQGTGEKAVLSFKKTHFKIIGASQKGKSSLVAAFLTIVSQTHTPDQVQFAVLDMEDMTGRLFTDLPHTIRHARNLEDVVYGLREIVSIMEERYRNTVKEIALMPIILIYLEEFLDLKNQLKAFNTALYKECVAHVTTLATRGLKARCQLLLCAQTEYRDSGGELAGALANIPNGFSVCLVPSAARAAGFTNTELLNRNYKENRVGVFVAKHPQLQGIVVGPDFDLERRLMDLEDDDDGSYLLPSPHSPTKAEIDLAEAQNYWNNGFNSENKIMTCYPGMTKYQANKLCKKLRMTE